MNDSNPPFRDRIQAAIDGKTKPPGSLGRIESLAAQLATLQQRLDPRAESCRLTIFAADHGIAEAGVSAYPQAVTRQMVQNFIEGGAAANVFARSLGAELTLVDAGVSGDAIVHPSLLDRRIGPGTDNALHGPAMTEKQLQRALREGEQLGEASDTDVVCFGKWASVTPPPPASSPPPSSTCRWRRWLAAEPVSMTAA